MRQDVYAKIRADLLNNVIAPGERLTIDTLADELGVSATLIREALLRLEGDDLVVKEPYKGYRATPLLNRDELEELFEFRLLIEPWAARSVAGRTLGSPARALADETEQLTVASTTSGVDRQVLMDHDVRFHDTIIAAAGNRTVRRAFQRTHCHLHLFRLCPPHFDGRQTAKEHEAITAALLAGDPDAAAASMEIHLTESFNRFAVAGADPE